MGSGFGVSGSHVRLGIIKVVRFGTGPLLESSFDLGSRVNKSG